MLDKQDMEKQVESNKIDDALSLDRSRYWNGYYSECNLPSIPSQFAVFVLNENPSAETIIDIGCGTGRDSLFFSRQGLFCIGVDGSESAIEHCSLTASSNAISNAEFLRGDLNDARLIEDINRILDHKKIEGPVVIYARFLVHAITDDEEKSLIDLADSLLRDRGGSVALEFRTERDKLQPKVTGTHFRRYVDPVHFFTRAQKNGFEVDYFVEGFGFAKYKQDDAHVARFILKRVG